MPDILPDTLSHFAIKEPLANESFTFNCSACQPCFNRCCTAANIPLTPYDVLRARRNLGISSEEFLLAFSEKNSIDDVQLPMPLLRMVESPDAPCPFLTPGGCSIYEDRPLACRSYPLSIGINLDNDPVTEKIFLIQEEGCYGFESDSFWTAEKWLEHESAGKYRLFFMKYMELAAKMRKNGKHADSRLDNLFFLSLYQLERFRDFICKMRLFSRLEIPEVEQEKIMADNSLGDEACLEFSFRWLHFLIEGKKSSA